MAFRPRATLPETALTLPARYYTDPALFERELDVFYRRMWIGIARLEDIPERGAWITRQIAGDNFIIVRAHGENAQVAERGVGDPRATEPGGVQGTPPIKESDVRAFYNVCRHRGTQLCVGEQGEFAGAIRCPYHAWTYDYEGKLIGAPHMDGSPGFDRSEFPLREVRAGVWDGFVFVCLSQTAPPLAEQLGELPQKFHSWGMGSLRRAHQITYDVAANWKLVVQNYNECLHCPTLHPTLNRLSHYLSGDNEPFRQNYMGGRMDLNEGAQTMSMDGTSPRAPLPGLSDDERCHIYYYSVFPNFMIAPHPDYVLTHTLWPLAPNRTRIICEWLVDQTEAAKPTFDLSDATTFWDMTNKQDWHVCELAQAGISSRGYQPGPYSNREDLLYAFDRFVVSKLAE